MNKYSPGYMLKIFLYFGQTPVQVSDNTQRLFPCMEVQLTVSKAKMNTNPLRGSYYVCSHFSDEKSRGLQ